jgi:hypothetical protein
MSGGSLDYIGFKIDECAETIRERRPKDYLLQALADHLGKLKDVLDSVEFDLSGDESLTDEDRAEIVKLIGAGKEMGCAIEDAKRIRDELNKLIKKSLS